jgi:ATP-dependent DNA ligase
VFDLLHYDGVDLRLNPLIERRLQLTTLLATPRSASFPQTGTAEPQVNDAGG